MDERAPVITATGCISPCGRGAEALWRALLAAEPAFRPLTLFDASPFRNALAGEVPADALPDALRPPNRPSRAVAFLELAAAEAVEAAGLAGAVRPERTGAVVGTNFGGAQAGLDALADWRRRPGAGPDLAALRMDGGLAALRRVIPVGGPAATQSLACASGTAALAIAAAWVRRGRADVVLAGGFDELSLHCYAGLSNLRAITKETIRPFHARRSGTLFSEGAGVLVVESAAHARARGADVLAHLLGGFANNDAHHLTAPDRTGGGVARVMRGALADAGLAPEDVDHVNCHATATKYNDVIEAGAMRTVFGAHADAMLFTGNKGTIGHAMGAAGALEAIATVRSLREGVVPPTAGLDEQDPEIDLDCCAGEPRARALRVALNNSYGLGGCNACAVFAAA